MDRYTQKQIKAYEACTSLTSLLQNFAYQIEMLESEVKTISEAKIILDERISELESRKYQSAAQVVNRTPKMADTANRPTEPWVPTSLLQTTIESLNWRKAGADHIRALIAESEFKWKKENKGIEHV